MYMYEIYTLFYLVDRTSDKINIIIINIRSYLRPHAYSLCSPSLLHN